MEPSELAALVDLIRLIADADGKLTSGESKSVDRIAAQVGSTEFWEVFQASAFDAARPLNLEALASAVTTPERRAQFFRWLSELAECDGLHSAEHEKLVALRRLWSVD